MKFALVYISPNGTTKSTTEILEKIIKEDGHSVSTYNLGSPKYRNNHEQLYEDIKDSDIIGFGSAAYEMDMLKPMKTFIDDFNMKNQIYNYHFKAFMYLNYAGITSGKAFINAAQALRKNNIHTIGAFKVCAPHFHHEEIFPTDDTLKTINDFYKAIKTNNFKEIEFERIKKVFAPEKKIINLIYPFVSIISKIRTLPIKFNKNKCRKCKKCINECPIGAISLNEIPMIDFNKCVHCYHCTKACNLHAIECPIEKLDKMIAINKKIIGMENPLNKIYI